MHDTCLVALHLSLAQGILKSYLPHLMPQLQVQQLKDLAGKAGKKSKKEKKNKKEKKEKKKRKGTSSDSDSQPDAELDQQIAKRQRWAREGDGALSYTGYFCSIGLLHQAGSTSNHACN